MKGLFRSQFSYETQESGKKLRVFTWCGIICVNPYFSCCPKTVSVTNNTVTKVNRTSSW